jgi:hypothetical protein
MHPQTLFAHHHQQSTGSQSTQANNNITPAHLVPKEYVEIRSLHQAPRPTSTHLLPLLLLLLTLAVEIKEGIAILVIPTEAVLFKSREMMSTKSQTRDGICVGGSDSCVWMDAIR